MSLRTDPRTDGRSDDGHRSYTKQKPGDKRAAVWLLPAFFFKHKFVTNRQTNPGQQPNPDKTGQLSWTLSETTIQQRQEGRAGLNKPGDNEPQVRQVRLITGEERTKVILT